MDSLLQNLSSAHPVVIIAVIFAGLLIVYFLFKQLVKLALLFLLILLVAGGYFYFKEPARMPRNMMETLEKAGTETGKAVEKGRDVYEKGKAVAEKGKEVYTKGMTVVERGKKLADGMDNLQIGKSRKADGIPDQGKK